MKSRKGFTLIELLVVIAIIALLLGIIVPVLRKAKEATRKVVCANNERQVSVAFRIYTEQNEGFLPLQGFQENYLQGWAWALSYWTTDLVIESGSIPDVFYCPSNRSMKADDDTWWRYAEARHLAPQKRVGGPEPTDIQERKRLWRCVSYYCIIDNDTMTRNETKPLMGLPVRKWLARMQDIKSPSSAELITDTVLRQNGSYTEVRGGHWTLWEMYDSTCHVDRNDVVEGQNVIFADGHSKWRKHEELLNPDRKVRVRVTTPSSYGTVEGIW